MVDVGILKKCLDELRIIVIDVSNLEVKLRRYFRLIMAKVGYFYANLEITLDYLL